MKLLMENWRRYVTESEQSEIYGKMYIFEDDNIREVSFSDHLGQLNENGGDVERFLEKWERSVDYMFENLDEQAATGAIDNAILKASTQAWMALDKLKGKAVGSVINVMKKLKGYEQKNPNAAKAIKITVTGLAAAAAAAGVYQAMKSGGDAGAVQELAQALSAVEPDVAKDVAEVAQNLTPESAVELVNSQEQTVSQVADTLSQSGDQGLQQVAQAAEQVETSTFEDIMSDLQAERGPEDTPESSPEILPGEAGPTDGGFSKQFPDLAKEVKDNIAYEEKKSRLAQKLVDQGLGDRSHGRSGKTFSELVDFHADNAKQWKEFQEVANTFAEGGDIADLGMSKGQFNKWLADHQDKGLRRLAVGRSSGPRETGHIPAKAIKWLAKLWRMSEKGNLGEL